MPTFELWLAVNVLLQRYADAIDRADIPTVADLFAPAGVWDYSPTTALRGRNEIGAYLGTVRGRFHRTSHHIGPPMVTTMTDSPQIGSTAYFMAVHSMVDGTAYTVWGRYVDRLTPSADGLLIDNRQVIAHVTEGTERSYHLLEKQGTAGVPIRPYIASD